MSMFTSPKLRKTYTVLSDSRLSDLEECVNRRLQTGWDVVGGVTALGDRHWAQAMVSISENPWG
jgi:hypothetical protein